ncbi:MAG: hypothetical protein FJ109_17840 [Deltaproteobacteria bacterium]|nr:hypothetical protein [Deltaproteobacteria bacterium]
MALTNEQRRALLMAYSDDHLLTEGCRHEWGVAARTIRSLQERGFIVAGQGRHGSEYDITEAGKDALGARWPGGKVPKRFRTALQKALEVLGVPLDELEFKRPREVTQAWSRGEEEYDFSDALLVVVGAHMQDDVVWSAVARMLSEAGFFCYAEVDRYHVGFWPVE